MKKVIFVVLFLAFSSQAQAKDKVVYEACIKEGMRSMVGDFHDFLVPTYTPLPICSNHNIDCLTGGPVEQPHYLYIAIKRLRAFCEDAARR